MTEEEEDSEAIKTELREAFRLYDKEGSVHATRQNPLTTQNPIAFNSAGFETEFATELLKI